MVITLSKRNILFILVGLLFAGFLGVSLVSAAATDCGSYKPGIPPPPGYGAAYNVFSPSQLLLKVTCDTNSVELEAGAGGTSQAVYEKGYHYRNGSWQQITMSGSKRLAVGSPYFEGSAEVAIPSSQLVDGANYVVAYTCTSQSGQWKCGCSDASCTQGKWQLQAFNFKVPPTPTPKPECSSISPCAGGTPCENGKCVVGSQCGGGFICSGGAKCLNGWCVPGSGQTCGGGFGCPTGETCAGGACVPGSGQTCGGGFICPTGEQCFNGICLRDAGSGQTCGGGFGCPTGETCENQVCRKR